MNDPAIEKPQGKKGYWKLILAVLVIASGLFLWARLAPQPFVPLAFEVVGFEGDVQISDSKNNTWHTPKRGEEFSASQMIKTGKDGIINLQVENKIMLRLKENAELFNKECKTQGGKDIYKLRLEKGALLGATTKEFDRKLNVDKTISFVVTTPHGVVTPNGAVFRILAARSPEKDVVGVLSGSVEVSPVFIFIPKAGVRVRGLQTATLGEGVTLVPKRVNTQEWQAMKESYELLTKSAAKEAEQINLSKFAGSFFKDVVFDHGTFFTPKVGYAGREFFKDPDSGQVLLEAEYDVFPVGSFCGVYIKTRGLDLSKYTGFFFEIRGKAEEGVPESFFIEMKSKGNVVRRFAPRNFGKDWQLVEFDFHAQKPLPVNEMVFVFTNARAGEAKKGVLQFRNINLISRATTEPASPQEAVQMTVSTPPTSATQSIPEPVATQTPTPAPAATSTSAAPEEVALQ